MFGINLRHIFLILAFVAIGIPASAYELSTDVGQEEQFLESYSEVFRVGRGEINTLNWSPDSQHLAVATDIGIWIYTSTLETSAFLESSSGTVNDIAWFQDNTRIISIDSSGLVSIWNVDTGNPETIASISDGSLRGVALNTQETLFATVSANAAGESSVQVWDTQSREVVHTIPIASGHLRDVQWSEDGAFLAASTFSNRIFVWDASQNWQEVSLEASGLRGSIVQWSGQNAGYLLTDGEFGYFYLFDVNAQELVDTIEARNLNEFALSSYGTSVAYSRQYSTDILALSLQEQEIEPLVLTGHTASPRSIVWSSDGRYLASHSSNELIVWDWETQQPTAQNALHLRGIFLLASNTEGSHLSALAGGCLYLLNVSTSELSTDHEDLCYEIQGFDWKPDSDTLAILGRGWVQVWDRLEGQVASTTVDALEGSLFWSIDGEEIIVNSRMGEGIGIFRIDIETGELVPLSPQLGVYNADIVNQSRDGRSIALVDRSSGVIIWNTEQRAVVANLSLGEDRGIIGDFDANNVAWSPDGRYFALLTFSADRRTDVLIWDVASGELDSSLFNNKHRLSIAWSTDGTLLASANRDGSIDIWDTSTYMLVMSVQGHQDAVNSLAWLPDGQLASASSDGTVRLWSFEANQQD